MGYGKKAENKDKKLAITDEEAKFWLDYLKLSRFRDSNPAGVNEEPGEDSSQSGEEPMIIDFPTQEDTQAFDEDIVDPIDSGLQIPEKGSYIMFFSILLMFDKKRRSRHAVNVQDKKPGPNKVSDFLLFWIIPYLMNYSERKVTEIIKHNTAKGKASPLTVKKSTMDIFHAVVTMNREMSPEQKDRLEEKYRKYYGTKLLETEYTLLASEKTAPIILVPMEYQVSKTILPAIIKDLGKRESWKKIGRYSFTDEFLSRFLQNREIQKDFFDSMKDMKRRQVIDYGIILPDEKTFQELQEILVRDHADTLSHEECQSQGRHFIVPRVGLVKHLDKVYKNVIVAFSYLQGKGKEKVAALYRAIGSHYHNHFSLVLLHGSVCNGNDPDCVLGNLYPIKNVSFKGKHLQRAASLGEKYSLSKGIGKFTGVDFPQTYRSWEHEICEDKRVKKVLMERNITPQFHHSKSLVVGYSQEKFHNKLRRARFKASMKQTKPDKGDESMRVSNRKKLNSCEIKAVNFDGCALSLLAKHGRKNNLGVVLAVNDTFEASNLVLLPEVVRIIVSRFVMAVIIAGLPLVYPSKRDAEDRDDEAMAATVSSSDDDDDDDDDDSSDSENDGPESVSAPLTRSEPACNVKQGNPSEEELEYIATFIGASWKLLGRRLGIGEGQLTGFHEDYEELSEKAYQMLLHWKQNRAAGATYQVLFDALTHELVGRRDLAERFCCNC